MPTFTRHTVCTVLPGTQLSAAAVAANRAVTRAVLMDRFTELDALFRRDDDLTEAPLFVSPFRTAAPLPTTARWDDSDSDDDDDDAARTAARAANELTMEHAVAALKAIDAVTFGGGVAALFRDRGWALELRMGDWARDGARMVSCEDGTRRRAAVTQRRRDTVGVELLVSARVPSSLCFDGGARPRMFGVACRDALDVLLVQLEHQLVHAALLAGGCAEADVDLVTILAADADSLLAARRGDVALAADALAHGDIMAAAVRGAFGHDSAAHGAHVWGAIVAASTEGCCMEDAPPTARPLQQPSEVKSLWMARRTLRRALARGDVSAAAFDPVTATWRSGWRVEAVGRWYARLSRPDCTHRADRGAVLLPLHWVRATVRGAKPRFSARRMEAGYYRTLGYDTMVVLLPSAAEDVAAHARDDEDAAASKSGDAGGYVDSLARDLPLAYFKGAVDKYGTEVSVRVASEAAARIVPATSIMPFSLVGEDPLAPT